MARAEPPSAGASPIFLLSFRHRDALAGVAGRAGWPVIAARRAGSAERRFRASGAAVAIVDARDALDAGLEAARALGPAAEAAAAALLVVIDRPDVTRLDAFYAAGATHYLASPFGEVELTHAIRFAARHAARLAGGDRAARDRSALMEGEAESWRWRPGERDVTLTAPLARRIGGGRGRLPLFTAARPLGGEGIANVRRAVARLLYDGRPTAFAHETPGGRVAHHIRIDREGRVTGHVEKLEEPDGQDTRSRDPLTGLIDATGLRGWLDAARPPAEGPRPALLLIGLDRLGIVNAAHGSAAGDALLRVVARRIEREVADAGGFTACVARIAGTGFAIALADGGEGIACDLAERLTDAIARPFAVDDRIVRLSCHVGIAAREPGDDGAALLHRAGAALAQARIGEPGAILILDASGEAAAARRERLARDLRDALARDEIELVYQPQVSIPAGRIVGVEALARWRHPEFGPLGAVTLFSVAERSDFLLPLSEHVQRKALAQAAAWGNGLAGLRLAVNVTAADLARPGFTRRFLALVDEAGFPRDRLTVELTESGLVDDLGEAAGLLAELRAEGLRVAVDDFGTGYSSLAYLKTLPLDYLKIDKRLVDDISGSPRDRVVVRGVIEMARSLGMAVIVEGVESEAQLDLLAAEGCNFYQGFLCSPPVDVAALERLVARNAQATRGRAA